MHSFCLLMNYACTFYSTSQPKTIAEYLRTCMISFGGTIYTSLTNNWSINPIRLSLLIVVSVPAANHNIYPMNLSCQHAMKASPIITVHYSNSICTITAVQTMLTYIIETTYLRGYRKMRGMNSDCHTLRRTIYSQYTQPKLIYWQHLK
jgi:hypothetical protein